MNQENITRHIIDNYNGSSVRFDNNRIVIYAKRPSIVIGKSGIRIKQLAFDLKEYFSVEKPIISVVDMEKKI